MLPSANTTTRDREELSFERPERFGVGDVVDLKVVAAAREIKKALVL